MLVNDIASDCRDIIEQSIGDVKGKIEALEIMPDHVHLFVSIGPQISPHALIKRVKGATSNILRKRYPQLSKIPALWSSSYYIGTVGHASESVVKLYIENQKSK